MAERQDFYTSPTKAILLTHDCQKEQIIYQIFQVNLLKVLLHDSSALGGLPKRRKKDRKIGGKIQTLICLLFLCSVHVWTGESSNRWYIFKAHVKNRYSYFK